MECEGVCRCCAADGPSKYLDSSYLWMGETEVYSEMLKACFDITLKAAENGKNGGICSICITQLRNAYNFKKQVLFTEEQFHRKLEDENSQVNIKLEVDPEDDGSSDHHADDDDDDDIKEYEVNIKDESAEEKAKPKRPARQSALKTKRAKIEKAETSSSTEIPFPKVGRRKNILTDMKKNELNLVNILLHSNASLFRSRDDSGFICLLCPDQYFDAGDLKKHFLKNHSNEESLSRLRSKLFEHGARLDISYLNCSICDTDFTFLDDLVEHLDLVHGKMFYQAQYNLILPFKFEKPRHCCALCDVSHPSFKLLFQHMHSHYRNFVCDVCDKGYAIRSAYMFHMRSHTEQGQFNCAHCDKVFVSKLKAVEHERRSHLGVKRNKCRLCLEMFYDHNQKFRHVQEVHGITETHACNACDKVFDCQKTLAVHVKKFHLMERKHKCTFCDKGFFKSRDLRDHLIKHVKPDTKEHECQTCGRSYFRRKSLLLHMKSHVREFSCELCARTFTQKCSLKHHLKVKHSVLE